MIISVLLQTVLTPAEDVACSRHACVTSEHGDGACQQLLLQEEKTQSVSGEADEPVMDMDRC